MGDKIITSTREKFLNPGKENITKPMKIVEELQTLDSISNIKFRFGSKKLSKNHKEKSVKQEVFFK